MIGLCPLPWITDETDSWWGLPAGVRSIIDLRPTADCGKRGTYGDFPHVLMLADSLPKADGWETLSDGDPRDLRVDQKLLDTWASLTGIAVQGDTLADLIWWHLTANADPKGLDRCKPLIPTRQNLELWSGGLLRSEPFTLADAHANKVLAVVQDDYRAVFEQVQQGKAPTDLHRKVLDDLCDKYAVSKTDRTAWEKFVPVDLRTEIEGPKRRTTSYSENFDGSDSDTMGHQLTWAEQGGGDWDNESNRGVLDLSSSSYCSCRAEHDLSSSDHYAQVVLVSTIGYYGPAARFSSSAQTLYSSEASGSIWRLIKFVAGSRTQLTADEPGSGGTNRVRVAGSTITGYRNGTQYNSTTDTAISSGTRCGMYGRNNAGVDISFDDWFADDEVVVGSSSPSTSPSASPSSSPSASVSTSPSTSASASPSTSPSASASSTPSESASSTPSASASSTPSASPSTSPSASPSPSSSPSASPSASASSTPSSTPSASASSSPSASPSPSSSPSASASATPSATPSSSPSASPSASASTSPSASPSTSPSASPSPSASVSASPSTSPSGIGATITIEGNVLAMLHGEVNVDSNRLIQFQMTNTDNIVFDFPETQVT